MILKKKRKSNFTLLEICICVAILGVASVTIGWQMKNMLSSHHFHQNVSNLLTDLRKCQLLALSDRIDIQVKITKTPKGFAYTLHTDEPNGIFSKKPKRMEGIKAIYKGKRQVNELTLDIYSTGRIEKLDKIRLLEGEDRGVELDFSRPHLIHKKTIEPM